MGLPVRALIKALIGGGALAANPLRFASSTNYIATNAGAASSGEELNVRCRTPFYIGSGDMESLKLSFNGFYLTSSGAVNYANAYTVIKASIEKDGATSSVPVTFSGGRTQLVSPGDVDIQSDSILPSSFGLGEFTRDDLYWIRLDYSVASAGQILPKGSGLNYTSYGFPDAVGIRVNPAVYSGGDVDSYGIMSIAGGGWSEFSYHMVPFVLGVHVTAAASKKTFILIGDSIVYGVSDTNSQKGFVGMTRALANTDRTTGHYSGANFGMSGANADIYSGASGTKLTPFIQYAGYAFEEFGTNRYESGAGPSASTVITQCRIVWDACASVDTDVLRMKLLPRTSANGTTITIPSFQTGGNARLFNVALESESGITLVTRNSLRAGTTEGTDAFYQWVGGATNTADGLHPNASGTLLDAADVRAAIAALP